MLSSADTSKGESVVRGIERPARRAGIRRGAKIMFLSAILFPIFFGLCFLADSLGPLLVPLTIFLAGLASLLYSVFFGEELLRVGGIRKRGELQRMRDNLTLDAPQFVPASVFSSQKIDTSELAQPHSITENTTKLLDKDQT